MLMFRHDVEDRISGFKHRIVVLKDGMVDHVGDYVPYGALAQVTYEGKEYRAATQFFEGVLPTEKVFRIEVVVGAIKEDGDER